MGATIAGEDFAEAILKLLPDFLAAARTLTKRLHLAPRNRQIEREYLVPMGRT